MDEGLYERGQMGHGTERVVLLIVILVGLGVLIAILSLAVVLFLAFARPKGGRPGNAFKDKTAIGQHPNLKN